MFSQCLLHCPVCKGSFDWHGGYGREIRCCSRECHQEAEWRRTLSIMGKEYYPDPRKAEPTDARTQMATLAHHSHDAQGFRVETCPLCSRTVRVTSLPDDTRWRLEVHKPNFGCDGENCDGSGELVTPANPAKL